MPPLEGYGAVSRGGEGGQVIVVDTLRESGPGSLRAALESQGPRIVVFRVGGFFNLSYEIAITDGRLTVAGETAPDPGVILRSQPGNPRRLIRIGGGVSQPEHIIIRYITMAKGKWTDADAADNIVIRSGAYIIIHNVSSWFATDQSMSIDPEPGRVAHDVTFQHNIFAATLYPHSTGILVASVASDVNNISVHHNLCAHISHRVPVRATAEHPMNVQVASNIIYNWAITTRNKGTPKIDYCSNLWKAGPWTMDRNGQYDLIGHEFDMDKIPSLNLIGNRAEPFHSVFPEYGQREMVTYQLPSREGDILAPPSFFRGAPLIPGPSIPITLEPPASLLTTLLPRVGNSHRMERGSTWVPRRHIIDKKLVADVLAGTGPARNEDIMHQDNFGGYGDFIP